jgi:glutamine amidotransferase
MKLTLLDTGAGNLHSLEKALLRAVPGSTTAIETDPARALGTDVLVLPGVGAFGPAAARLASHRSTLREALLGGLPAIGVCLGMQLLFSSSEEGDGAGLDVIPGRVTRLRTPRTPHMGWTPVTSDRPWLNAVLPAAVYFAHTFACRPEDASHVLAESAVPGDTFAAVVQRGRTIGAQFHPEKSSAEGVALLGRLIAEITR